LGTPYKITTYSNVSGFFMPVNNVAVLFLADEQKKTLA